MKLAAKLSTLILILSVFSITAFAGGKPKDFKKKGKIQINFDVDETSQMHNATFVISGKLAKRLFQKLNPKGYQTNVADVNSRKDETEIKQSHFIQCKRDHKDYQCTFTFMNNGQPAQLDELYLGGEGSIPLEAINLDL